MSEGAGGYDYSVDQFPGEYIPRFSRDKLDAVGQKIFDQLKQQREMVEKKIGADEAKRYYSDLTGLNKDESTALMAAELQSTGITDIYKVKQDVQRIPVREEGWAGSGGEGGYESGINYILPDGTLLEDSSRIKRDAKGQPYIEKTQYVNTETGQAIAPNADRAPFSGRQDVLSDYSVGKRRDIGTGVTFNEEGIPVYFSQGVATPSSWKSFTNQAREAFASPVGKIALAALLGPAGAGFSAPVAGALAGGVSGLAAEGDLADALKGAALGYGSAYALGELTGGAPSGLDAGMGTYDVSGFNPVYSGVDDLFSGSGVPTPNVVYPELFPSGLGDPTAAFGGTPELPQFSPEDMVPPSALPQPEAPTSLDKPAWDTGYPESPEVPQGSLAAEVGPPEPLVGPPEPLVGPPEPLVGPPEPSTGERFFGDLKAFAATPLGRLALSLGGSALVNKLFEEKKSGATGPGVGGWSGEIPKFQAVRERVPFTDTERRPGEYGRRYFSDTSFVPIKAGEENLAANVANIAAAKELAAQQAVGLASIPVRQPVVEPVIKRWDTTPYNPRGIVPGAPPALGLPSLPTYENEPRLKLATGGIAQGRYLDGTTDGMEDKLPANIDGQQPARLSHGEFVVPADVVSHLGNGNSQAGAKRLYEMMDRIRQARTGTKKQGKQINANKYLPV